MYSYPLVPFENFYITNQGFLSDEYFKERGKWHRGIDINLKSGGNTDYGYPVVSMLPGTVIFSQIMETNWGGLVLIRTDDVVRQEIENDLELELPVLDLLYAHLLHTTVSVGQFVNSGTAIGSVGDGHGAFPAHLHLETRVQDFIAYKPQDTDKQFVLDTCINPLSALNTGFFSNQVTNLPFGRYTMNGDIYYNDRLAGKNAIINRVNGKKVYIKV